MDGNHEVFDCFVVAVGRVSGGTVGGTGLGIRVRVRHVSCFGDTLIQFKCFSKLNQFFLDSLHFVGGRFVVCGFYNFFGSFVWR